MSTMIENALAQFNESAQAIASVKEYANYTVAVDGIGKVHEARMQIRRLRIGIEKRRKELKEGALAYGRAVDGEAKRLTAEIEPIEEKLENEEAAYEAEKAKAKAAVEAEKRAKLQSRLNRLGMAGVTVRDVAAVESMDDTEFEFHFTTESRKAEEARQRAEQARREAEEFLAQQRKEREELAAKLAAVEAEKAELQRQQAEARRQEDERRAAELKAQQEAERQAREAALAPERDKAIAFTKSLHECAQAGLAAIGNPYWAEEAMFRVRQACKLIVDAVVR